MTYWRINHDDLMKNNSQSILEFVVLDNLSRLKQGDDWVPNVQIRVQFKEAKHLTAFLELVPLDIIENLHFPKNHKTDPFNCNPFCYTHCNNLVIGKFFLTLINKFDPMDDNLREKVASFLGFDLGNLDLLSNIICDLNTAKQVYTRLLVEEKMLTDNNLNNIFKQLFADSLKKKDPDALFVLGQYYQNFENDHEKALICYAEIPEEIICYKAANLNQAEIALQSRQAKLPPDSSKEVLSAEDIKELALQNDFYLSSLLNAKNPEFQSVIDQLFAEMIGEKGLQPSLTGIRADGETIVRMAKKINTLQVQKEELKNELYKMKQKNAYLNMQEKILINNKARFYQFSDGSGQLKSASLHKLEDNQLANAATNKK